jgi:hypothetical protein
LYALLAILKRSIDPGGSLKDRRLQIAAIVAGDLLMFLAFAFLGTRSHDENSSPGHVITIALPFQAGWLLSAAAIGILSPAALRRPGLARRVVAAWIPGWLLGVIGRAFVFGGAVPSTFGVISFLTNAVLLVGWRLVASRLLGRAREALPAVDRT